MYGRQRTIDFTMINVRLITLLVLALGWPGCVYLPLPAKVVWGGRVQQSDLTFVKAGFTTRSEMVERFGMPDKSYAKPPVSVYWWLERTGYYAYGVPGPYIGWAGDGGEVNRTGLLLILFDEDDHVRKVQVRYAPRSGVTEDFVAKWISTD